MMWKIFAIFIAFMTVVTFIVYGIDKWKAAHERWRIPESTLFLLAIFGGSLGALLGMQVWRHKTQHWTFRLGIPLIFVLQVALFIWLFYTPES